MLYYFKTRSSISFFYMILAIIFTSCAQQSPASGTPTMRPTNTVVPIQPIPTSTPTIIPSLTQTLTPTLTLTSTPAPLMDFSQAKVINIGLLPQWKCLITLQLPDEVKGQYFALVNRNKEYDCEVLKTANNRLYCIGPLAGVDKFVNFKLYQKDLDYPVFEADLRMPAFP